jgi:hypothetical protein
VACMQARLRATATLNGSSQVWRHLVPQSLQAYAKAYSDKRTATAAAYVPGTYKMKAIVVRFGVRSSTVNRAVRRAEGQ